MVKSSHLSARITTCFMIMAGYSTGLFFWFLRKRLKIGHSIQQWSKTFATTLTWSDDKLYMYTIYANKTIFANIPLSLFIYSDLCSGGVLSLIIFRYNTVGYSGLCISTLKTKYLADCTEKETFCRQQETLEPLFLISGERQNYWHFWRNYLKALLHGHILLTGSTTCILHHK